MKVNPEESQKQHLAVLMRSSGTFSHSCREADKVTGRKSRLFLLLGSRLSLRWSTGLKVQQRQPNLHLFLQSAQSFYFLSDLFIFIKISVVTDKRSDKCFGENVERFYSSFSNQKLPWHCPKNKTNHVKQEWIMCVWRRITYDTGWIYYYYYYFQSSKGNRMWKQSGWELKRRKFRKKPKKQIQYVKNVRIKVHE